MFAGAASCADVEHIDGGVSSYDSTDLCVVAFFGERFYGVWGVLVRYFLAWGFKIALGVMSGLSAIAIDEPERDVQFSTVDPCAEHHPPIFGSRAGVSVFQIRLKTLQIVAFPRFCDVKFREIRTP